VACVLQSVLVDCLTIRTGGWKMVFFFHYWIVQLGGARAGGGGWEFFLMVSIIWAVQLEGKGYARVFFFLETSLKGPSWEFSKNRNEHGIFKYLKKRTRNKFYFCLDCMSRVEVGDFQLTNPLFPTKNKNNHH